MKHAKPKKIQIDLHVHTFCSDGDYSPSAIVRMAHEQGIDTIAITDHDTVSGLEEALAEGKRLGVEVIPGVEISARNGCSVHILGYFSGQSVEEIAGIEKYLKKAQKGRTERTYRMIDLLNKDGYKITKKDVDAFRKGVYTSKELVRKALIRKGYFKDHAQSLKLMEDNKYDIPYSVEWAMKPEDAILLITSYGGKAVLAHPGKLMKKFDVKEFIGRLVKEGLKGLEVYSTKHSEKQMKYFEKIAEEHNLTKIYGTDFHRNEECKVMGIIQGAYVNHTEIIEALKNS